MKPAKKLRLGDQCEPSVGVIAARVESIDGTRCKLEFQGCRFDARIAPHVFGLEPGLQVLSFQPGDSATLPLVIAAYPREEACPTESPLAYDAGTRTLSINASRLRLAAVDQVELVCGTARLRLNLSGEITLKAEAITASATGRHRIEGATIDLN